MSEPINVGPDDHRVHLHNKIAVHGCDQCRYVQRYPVVKVGWVTRTLMGAWIDGDWEFDKTEGMAWQHQDMFEMGRTLDDIAALPEVADEDRDPLPPSVRKEQG